MKKHNEDELNIEINKVNEDEIKDIGPQHIWDDKRGLILEETLLEEARELEETLNKIEPDPNETELTRVIKKELNIGKTEGQVNEKLSRRQFKGTASTILLGLIILFAILSWFMGGQSWNLGDNEVTNIPNQKYGLFDVLRFLEEGFINDIGGIWFLLIASGAMGVFIRTGASQALMQKMKGSEFFTARKSLITVMVFISMITTTFSANYLLVALAVFAIPLLVFNGYDIITGLMALLFASAAGQMASVFNGDLILKWAEVMNAEFGSAAKQADLADGLVFRLIIFVLFTSTAITIVSNYGDKVLEDFKVSKSRKETSRFIQTGSVIFGNKGKENMTTGKKVILISFFTIIFISMLGVIPLHDFGFTFFYDVTSKWSSDDHFMRIVWGTSMNPIGEWGYLEISYMFILLSIIVAFASSIPQRKYLQGMARGMNTALNIVLILTLSGALFHLLNESGLYFTIFYNIINFFQEILGPVGVPIGGFMSSIIFSGVFPIAQDLMEIIAQVMPKIIYDLNGPSFEFLMFVGTSITIGAGLVSIIVPTSAITIGLIWAYKIPYNKWVKAVWMPLLQFAAIAFIMVVAYSFILI